MDSIRRSQTEMSIYTDRWRRDRDKELEQLIYQQARSRLANRASAKQSTSPSPLAHSELSWKEYLGYVLMFVFLGTSFVYTYLAYVLREIRPLHNAMGALSAHKFDLPPTIPPPPPTMDPRLAEKYLEDRENKYYRDSDITIPSKILLDISKVKPCLVANADEKPALRIKATHICTGERQLMEGDKRLLTLVTTSFDSIVDQNPHTTANMLRLWPKLGARVRPVLFLYDPEEEYNEANMACQQGWDVLVAPVCDDDGAPYISDMLTVAEQLSESRFYGYAHRNTLFDMSLIKTLKFLDKEMEDFPKNLIVGQRTNLKLLNFNPSFNSLDALGLQTRARGTIGWLMNVDYFFMTKGGFKVPSQMVSGTRQIGNWAVWDALLQKTPVVDIGNSTIAVHQMSWTAPRKVIFSEPDLPEGFEMTYGMVWCAPLKVKKFGPKRMVLMKRIMYGLCGPGQWSRLPINHPLLPKDKEEEFVKGGSIMFQRMD